ncbi:MAG TPA: divalent metal cation transporter, partial [Lacipirellulaceae bacterium]|nr:divalent metal cation transporter [Lacipirellulaceae bacterium]
MHESLGEHGAEAIRRVSSGSTGSAGPATHVSLEGIHGTVAVPENDAQFWRNWRAYVGPALLVSVGYMDPGNWATDLAGGAKYGFSLLSVVLISNLMAIVLQHLALKLGV